MTSPSTASASSTCQPANVVYGSEKHRGFAAGAFMRLFTEPPTAELRPARHGESHFDYLSQSGRRSFGAIRTLTESWLSEVPHPHRRRLRDRLRNRDNHHFTAAFFELYLHTLLVRIGKSVKLHPVQGAVLDPISSPP